MVCSCGMWYLAKVAILKCIVYNVGLSISYAKATAFMQDAPNYRYLGCLHLVVIVSVQPRLLQSQCLARKNPDSSKQGHSVQPGASALRLLLDTYRDHMKVCSLVVTLEKQHPIGLLMSDS